MGIVSLKIPKFQFPMPNNKDIRTSTIDRLHRLEGQVKGIERLVDQNKPLPIILQQLAAASSAVRSLMVALVEDRLQQKEDGSIAVTPEEAGWIKRLLRK